MTPRPRTDRAFERLYRSHVRAVYRFALAVLPTPKDAEHVTQRTFRDESRFQDEGTSDNDVRRALREEIERTLTCQRTERAISRNLDGLLSRRERRVLRVHVCECDDCDRLDRSQRAQRVALRALNEVSLPHSLSSFFAEDTPENGPLSRA